MGQKKKELDVLVVTNNEEAYVKMLYRLLQTYCEECDMHMYIVDNGSSDHTYVWAKEQAKITCLRPGDELCGYVSAIHHAVQEFNLSRHLLIMQAPFMPTPGSISRMLDEIESEEYSVAGPVSNGFIEIQKVVLESFQQACTYQQQVQNEVVPVVGLESGVVMLHQSVVQNQLMEVSEEYVAPEEAIQDLVAALIMDDKNICYVKGAVMFSICGIVLSKQYYDIDSKSNQMDLLEQKWGMKYFNRKPSNQILCFPEMDNQKPIKVLKLDVIVERHY